MAILKTDEGKAQFLLRYASSECGGNISTVCDSLGMSRTQYYEWLEKDEEFRNKMRDIKLKMVDDMEQQLYQRGFEKSDTALIFWLKHNTDKYKDTPTTLMQVNGGEIITVTPSSEWKPKDELS